MSVILPPWLNNRIHILRTQGRLNLCGEQRTDLTSLTDPEIFKQLNMMKILDVSKTQVSTLEGLPFFKRLTNFNGDRSQISTLKNFKSLQNATSVSLIGTPISKHPTYKLSLLLVIGNGLKLIDGKLIPNLIRRRAENYAMAPAMTAALIDAGWMAEWPCPPVENLMEICKEYRIENSPAVMRQLPIDISVFTSPTEKISTEKLNRAEFETKLRKLKKRHEETLKRGKAMFGLFDESDDESMSAEISDILASHGIEVETGNDEAIVQSVRSLCIQKNQ